MNQPNTIADISKGLDRLSLLVLPVWVVGYLVMFYDILGPYFSAPYLDETKCGAMIGNPKYHDWGDLCFQYLSDPVDKSLVDLVSVSATYFYVLVGVPFVVLMAGAILADVSYVIAWIGASRSGRTSGGMPRENGDSCAISASQPKIRSHPPQVKAGNNMTNAQRTYLKWALAIGAFVLFSLATEINGYDHLAGYRRLLTITTYQARLLPSSPPCDLSGPPCQTYYYGWYLRVQHSSYGFFYGVLFPLALVGIAGFVHFGSSRASARRPNDGEEK
ncbi:MAG: hypothetical protein JNK07_04835 [Alphaproteobacteria bacterium]|nr:hypothetical protein [Alphaproteobacteria bacterium]